MNSITFFHVLSALVTYRLLSPLLDAINPFRARERTGVHQQTSTGAAGKIVSFTRTGKGLTSSTNQELAICWSPCDARYPNF